MATGDKFCKWCGVYLGNYMTGDYYKLIRQKYCTACAKESARQHRRMSKTNNAHGRKLLIEDLMEQMALLKEENRLLRQQVSDMRDRQN